MSSDFLGDARTRIGPNAFAPPGGTIVVINEMLELLNEGDYLCQSLSAIELLVGSQNFAT